MARQTYYLHRAVAHPLYKTRMLQAGPLELDASAARLYRKLGVELSEEAPKARTVTSLARPDADGSGNVVRSTPVTPKPTEAPKPAAKKAAPKRTTRRKK